MNAGSFTSLTCPLPDCDEDLYLDWQYNVPLFLGNTKSEIPVPTVDDAYTGTWEVQCGAGHTVLVPGPTGCPCEDQQGESCPHQGKAAEAYDWSEELRTFRTHDAKRLADLVGRLSSL